MNPEDQIRALQAEIAALQAENARLKGGDPYTQYGGETAYLRKAPAKKSVQNMPYRAPSGADEFLGTAPQAGPSIQRGPYRPGAPGPYIKKL